MGPDDEVLRIGRQRATQIFRYLEALNQHRNPARRQLYEQLWHLWFRDLPEHPSIRRAEFADATSPPGGAAEDAPRVLDDDFVLKVRRPKLAPCPSLPEILAPWLERGWEEPAAEVRIRESGHRLDEQGQTVAAFFQDDPKRQQAMERWRVQREVWARDEKPARAAMHLFEKLYEIRGQIEREGEKLELVLGDGILTWQRAEGSVFHPILLQRLQLEFDPMLPEFSIVEADSPVELYSALFQSMPDVAGRAIAKARQELEQGRYHPLAGEETSTFLRSLSARLSPQGEFQDEGAARPAGSYPVISRSAVIFLRQRNLGYAVAIQSVIESLSSAPQIPASLLRVVGIETQITTVAEDSGSMSWIDDCQPRDILFSKAANPEQVKIAQRLEQHGSALVQGPPGTGKTHTIANLIGHLLAQGKSILVTSHTTKALRVLRDQVVPRLRPLCVSLLDGDIDSRKQLESSVDAMVNRLSIEDAQQLERQAADLQSKRNGLVASHRELAGALLNTRADEYRDIVFAGMAYTPSDAARLVAAGRGVQDFIPGQVEPGCALPLSERELAELYRTNMTVSAEDEVELSGSLPDAGRLPSPDDFDNLVSKRTRLAARDCTYREDLWARPAIGTDLAQLEQLSYQLLRAAEQVKSAQPWQLSAMLAGYHGGEQRKPWGNLLALIDEAWDCYSKSQESFVRHEPELPEELPMEESRATSEQISMHLDRGGSLSFLTLATRSTWKKFIRTSRVATGEPKLPEHFQALRNMATLNALRNQLVSRWSRQMAPLGAPVAEALGPEPEKVCRQFSEGLRRCLDWHADEWLPLEEELNEAGLRFQQLLEEQPPEFSIGGELLRMADLLDGPVQEVLAARQDLIRWNSLEGEFAEVQSLLEDADGGGRGAAGELLRAVIALDLAGYRNAFLRLMDLRARRKHLVRRHELLQTLEKTAPAWALAISSREGIHGDGHVPPALSQAWLWRQLNDELDRRGRVSVRELQDRLTRTAQAIQDVTAELIECKAWAAQLRHAERNLQQKQALVGWLDTIRKMGKGTGIRVPKLKAEASRLMIECRGAVPVWIMPLSRVADNFDARSARFDVVIIDEASQSDVLGLLALYLGDKSVVVGDHEQVSPSAVGQDLGIVQHLIDEHLEGVPNAHLYDGQTSIYDLARQSFGSTIRLVEHFRCVPEIIQFSNQLSYEGAIRPLRDPSKARLKPHVIAHRVTGAASGNKMNEEEAVEVAALVIAAAEQPEYADRTFGVISLVGDEQACLIDSLLRKNLSEKEFKLKHNILCGNPAQFQGDERDVIFLSLVDSSDGGFLRVREESMFKQRFNVAASRARDQMWVVHSLDPRRHLKPEDLRRRLIEYAEDPYRALTALENTESGPGSALQKDVAARLAGLGYRVVPQWKVGHYVIDLVIENNGKRLAVECDGDRFHPLERLPDDMARLAVLQRLGWTFVRIRGSQFLRDPDRAMEPVLAELRAADIEPVVPGENGEAAKTQDVELRDRVVRRAQEVRRTWRAEDSTAARLTHRDNRHGSTRRRTSKGLGP
jgi:very-short-patch-repair endonuclease/DNA polymerase III delta prime subunit